MGFSQTTYEPFLRLAVEHDDYPDTEFLFVFQKDLPKLATEQDAVYIGLKDDVREDVKREQLARTVGLMLVEAPTGFDGFPADDRPLQDRMVEYFQGITEPGLKSVFSDILASAWYRYKTSKVPQVLLRPVKADGAKRNGDGRPAGGDPPGV